MSETEEKQPFPKSLSRKQRRVLGVLLEKAFTTPEQYPLTLKASTTGCNQKSNRDPVTNYSEDDVQQTLEELQRLGLLGCLHTEGGRTERYRHYMRHRTTLTEPQLAILTELLLRGKQQMGDLRTRASRMVAIDTQDLLRQELAGLMELGLVRANGPLDRRGIEVDHNLYADNENREPMAVWTETPEPAAPSEPVERPRAASAPASTSHLEETISELKQQLVDLRDEVSSLKDEVNDLRRQAGL